MIDYEQKYKESLSRAKQCYEGNSIYVLPKKDLEYIFHELAERDDEKIRKELIRIFSNREKYLIDQSFGGITVSEVLAWLEKQKKIEWTEKDKDNINGIINYLCQSDAVNLDGFNEWYDLLKSLKERINLTNNI